jgi:tRNA1Val (adenine37-N6)-methyltransferase
VRGAFVDNDHDNDDDHDGDHDDAITHDTLLRGRVRLLQPRHGFRSSLDPILLAGFVEPPFGRFLDLGCATGALAFLLLAKDPAATGVGVEIQPRLAELAARGCEANGFASRFEVLKTDVRSPGLLPARAFDLIATNPPFRPLGTGVLPPLSEKAMANHEVTLALGEWLDIALGGLAFGGRLAVIFPFDREKELRDGLQVRGLFVCRSRAVVPEAGQPPKRVLVEARTQAAREQVEPALIVHHHQSYTEEVRRMLGEDGPGR